MGKGRGKISAAGPKNCNFKLFLQDLVKILENKYNKYGLAIYKYNLRNKYIFNFQSTGVDL